MKLNLSGIYAITSPSGSQYIGSAVNLRLRAHGHRIALRKWSHTNRLLQNAWDKYGEEKMAFLPLIICDKADLIFYEQRALDILKPRYNICPNAASALGVRRSEATRERLRIASTGRRQSDETRAKRAASLAGQKRSVAARMAMSKAATERLL